MLYPVISMALMPAVKIEIKETGLYRITQADLSAIGIDTSQIQSGFLSLRNKDQSLAMRVLDGGDGSLNPGDELLFYAEGIAWDDPLYASTDINVYWLKETATPGKRMVEVDGAASGTGIPDLSALTTDHVEKDLIYYPGAHYPVSAKRWFMKGPVSVSSPVEVKFSFNQSVDITQQATIVVHLQGDTDTQENPDHHSQVTINNCVLGAGQYWNGFEAFDQQESIPANCLVAGENTVKLFNVGDTGAIVDGWYVDSFDIDYQQTNQAIQDSIRFSAQPPIKISGYSAPTLDAYAIGDPASVRHLGNTIITNSINGYEVSLDDPGRLLNQDEQYQVIAADQYKAPIALTVDHGSSLKTTTHSVDYIIISHPAFITAIQSLANHRRNEGLRVEVVDVFDIYDEFSFGIMTDQAIKDFLSYAYHNWQVKPSYVLLVGDATVSFKNQFSDNVPTYVPTHFYPAFDGSMEPSDNWFVTVAGADPLPDMFIGRLPVTPANINTVVQKIISYDAPSSDSKWMRDVLLVADNDDPVFETVSDEMATLLSAQYNINKVYLGQVNKDRFSADLNADKRNAVINNLRNGNVITAYTGHGGTGQWAAEGLLRSDDVDRTTNPDRLTFMVALNCLNGYFVQPTNTATNKLSLAESFVTSNSGGAVAAWAASYLGYTSDHRIMAEKLFSSIKGQGNQRLGSVTTQARIQALSTGADPDTLDSYIFFGDPATALASQRVTGVNSGGGGGAFSMIVMLYLVCAAPFVRYRYKY